MKPYFDDGLVQLYHGDYRDVLPTLTTAGADAVITDPPYGETSLKWDKWPTGWLADAAKVADSLWCFGSFRMFHNQAVEFADWKFSHEIVWQKQNGTGFATDKFRRVHELATFWYRGRWDSVHHDVPRVPAEHTANKSVARRSGPKAFQHGGGIGQSAYTDDGLRLMRSVIQVNNEQSRAVHPTQKPVGIVSPLVQYSVPFGGLVVDLFSGSGTTLVAARALGRRGIGVEADEANCESAARRLEVQPLDMEVA